MRIILKANQQQNPQFGMFKATPEVAEKLNNIFKLNPHSPNSVFKLNEDFLSELCLETPTKKIKELLERHPNIYATQNDLDEISKATDSFLKAEELAKNACDIKPEIQKIIEAETLTIDNIKASLSKAMLDANKVFKNSGLNVLG